MRSALTSDPPSPAATPLSRSIQAALALLLQAQEDELADEHEPGESAIAVSSLRSVGLSDKELRWLVDLQLVEHRHDTVRAGGKRRRKLPLAGPHFSERAWCQLTHGG